MKVLELLKQGRDYYLRISIDNSMTEEYEEAIILFLIKLKKMVKSEPEE